MDLTVTTLAERYKFVHQILREEIAGCTDGQVTYLPAPDTNSFAVLITHVLGSERQHWSIISGQGTDRVRATEFVRRPTTVKDLLDALDAADRLIDELAPAIDATALAKEWPRPDNEPHPGIYWFINNYGHAREHLAHLQMTKQLFPDKYPPIAHPM
jgi:hypothetical protein